MNLLVLYSMPINKDMTNKFGICPSTGHLSVLFPEKEAERTPSNKIFLAIVLQGGAMIEIDGKNRLWGKACGWRNALAGPDDEYRKH